MSYTLKAALLVAASGSCANAAVNRTTKPHLFMVLVDDLGYHNVPWYNPEQKAESLNQLVHEEGVVLTRFYTFFYCSPTRQSLLSGRFPIHVSQIQPHTMQPGADTAMTMMPKMLKRAGYTTSQIGKWHVGQRSVASIPEGRGFDYSLGYLSGAEDHNQQTINLHFEGKKVVDLWETDGPAYGKNGHNSCYLYGRKAVELVMEQPLDTPMFMYLAFQNCHSPYEYLEEYADKSVPHVRLPYNAMFNCVGDATINLTTTLKGRGMWENSLMLWTSDNGGPQFEGANNYPFRGGKQTPFEGGMRVAAFATGGLLHPSLRGHGQLSTMHTNLHVADVWPTFCALSGQTADQCRDPESETAPGVPDIDGIDFSQLFVNGTGANASRGAPIILAGTWQNTTESPSSRAYVDGDWKYVHWESNPKTWQHGHSLGYWAAKDWPREGKNPYEPEEKDPGCPADGCVFNLADDPNERHDLSSQMPQRQQDMKAQMAIFSAGLYESYYTYRGYDDCESEKQMLTRTAGWMAPMCKKGE